MAVDIAPELYERILEEFDRMYLSDEDLVGAVDRILTGGSQSYSDVYKAAEYIGQHMSKALRQILTSDVLPDGRICYNIATRTIDPALREIYDRVSKMAEAVQDELNKKAKIGMKPAVPKVDQDRIDGIMNRICSEADIDQVSWIMGEPIVNFAQNVVDESVRGNAKLHFEAGLSPTIQRIATGKCCQWCSKLSGKYRYEDAPEDIYRRHERCRCQVLYDPGDGRKQDAHSKEWISIENDDERIPGVRQKKLMEMNLQFFRDGADRRKDFEDGWEGASLNKAIEKFVPNYTVEGPTEKGKIFYESKESNYGIAYDNRGDYFRIYDKRKKGVRQYVDIMGNDVANECVNGKWRGRSKSDYQRITHFKNID